MSKNTERAGLIVGLALAALAAFGAESVPGSRAATAVPAAPSAPKALEPEPRVVLFTPEGSARNVRQVVARFSVDMVKLGDPWLTDPFTASCNGATGKGRWADTRNWVYDFDADLDAGIACEFSLKKDLASVAGKRVSGRSVFRFNTGGPAIVASLPREGWTVIDENQVFILRLDAPAETPSIESSAYCAVEGIGEQIPLRVLTGAERQAVLAQRRQLGYDYLQLLWKNGAETALRSRNRVMERRDEVIVAVQCARPLPAATRVQLHWGTGISTATGIRTTASRDLAFRVRPAFVAQVECTRSNPRAGCLPMMPITVSFSAPVPRALALGIRLRLKGGKLMLPAEPEPRQSPTVSAVSFEGPFAERSSPAVQLPAGLVDDAGRKLENGERFPLELQVDAYPPLVKFNGTFGILEAREGGILPVSLRNVEARLAAQSLSITGQVLRIESDPAAIISWLRRVEEAEEPTGELRVLTAEERSALKEKPADADEEGREVEVRRWVNTTGSRPLFAPGEATRSFTIDRPRGTKDTQVVGVALGKPGFYVVNVASPLLGASLLGGNQTRYVATAALVTDLAVHFKWGRESSLVWVTSLSSGMPVADAQVVIADGCNGQKLWQASTDAQGVAMVGESLGNPSSYGGCPYQPGRLVIARKGDDFSFSESRWAQGLAPYDFGLPTGSEGQARIEHSVFDRALYRPGETVSVKHLLREHRGSGFVLPASVPGAHKVEFVHEGDEQRYSLTAQFDQSGSATGTWTLPREAKLGEYRVEIDGRLSGRFTVGEFRLPSMHGSVTGPAGRQVAPKAIDLDLHVAYLSGGGAAGLPVKVRTVMEAEPATFAGYEDYTFGGEPIVEGVTTSSGSVADFDVEEGDENEAQAAPVATLRTLPLTLDASGAARVTIDRLPILGGAGRLKAELEFADANGEILTVAGSVRVVPSAVTVGIRTEGWVGAPGQVRFGVVVLDPDGKPLANKKVQVALFQSRAYSYRKRLLGGFYAYETSKEVTRLPTGCNGDTNAQGLLLCDVAPGVSGEVLLRAESSDSAGRVSGANRSVWVVGKDDWWYGGTQADRMDLLPERKEYQAGETARLQVRMPFRKATALITVEREGVIARYVQSLTGDAPVIDIPIADAYAPNVFVSVLAVRGRIPHVEGDRSRRATEVTGLVDLTKPAFRLGETILNVGWAPHRLDVSVTPAAKRYPVRARVPVRIHVSAPQGRALPVGAEVAVAAVDEALLDLKANDSWNLLAAMMRQRGIEVYTSTGQMQVVGKRHYGRKAVPHGGGGGRDGARARELFDSLLYWNSRVTLDAQGNAEVTVPLNDSLTSFRLVAVAQGGADLFGTGSANVESTQDLILQSGLPAVVREGDQFKATFTVRNTTERAMTVRLTASSPAAASAPISVALPAHGARDVAWDIKVPVNQSSLIWDVSAEEAGGAARDRLRVTEQVRPAFAVRTYQATVVQLTPGMPVSIPAAAPAGAVPGRGGLAISLQSSIAGSLGGVREWMSRYPYVCIEQQLSQAVALRSQEQWDAAMRRLPAYMDADGLVKYFPSDALQGDDTLTAYILSISWEAGYTVPDSLKERMGSALSRFVQGRLVRQSALPTADLTVRRLQAVMALARQGSAQPQMLESLVLNPDELPTSSLLDLVDVLERVPRVPDAAARRQAAMAQLRARLNFQGTTMGFSTERSDALWWLMISGDSNANRLILQTLGDAAWREDMARLVRGAVGRQQRGHWNTTVANAWGVLALEKFRARFESTAVGGSTAVRYGSADRALPWPAAGASGTGSPPQQLDAQLPWQAGAPALRLTHAGTGAPWALVLAQAALPLDRPVSTGFSIRRTVSAVEQQVAGRWTRGDVLRIHLDLEAQSDMSWVVVDDPVPAGATVLGSGIGGQSALMQRGTRQQGAVWLAYEERRFDGYRAYYRFVPKGQWSVEYTVRLDNPGTFVLPSTRVEAMYAPEMLGESPNAPFTVWPGGLSR